MPDGAVIERVAQTTNLCYTLAFSPDDSILAFAGGLMPRANEPYRDTQGITLKDLQNRARPLAELKGRGSTTHEVGFAKDGQTIALARRRAERPDALPEFEGFDLVGRGLVDVDARDIRRAVTTTDGWTVRPDPTSPFKLDVINARGQVHRIDLDPDRDMRWYSYSFIPRGPGHAGPCVAIGCGTGVSIHRLSDGVRTRFLAGHAGPVYSIAPSPDGKWLVTGSSDQTARVWSLDGCDVVAPLGATFRPEADGSHVVTAVAPRGFADRAGLKAGDVVIWYSIGGRQPRDFAAAVDRSPPATLIEMVIRRGREQINRGSTKREAAALSLFVGEDREWVYWMPEGYYETSAAGDRHYLGWHRNGEAMGREMRLVNPPPPTDYFPAEKFEAELRQGAILSTLAQTADLGRALAAARPVAPAAPPTPIEIVAAAAPPAIQVIPTTAPRPASGPLALNVAALAFRAVASSGGSGLIKSLRVRLDGRVVSEVPIDPPQADVDRPLNVEVTPGFSSLSVEAVNVADKSRIESLDVEYDARPPKPTRLVVVGVGTDSFADEGLKAIRFAKQDVTDASKFVAEKGEGRFGQVDDSRLLAGASATSAGILDAARELEQAGLGPGDMAVVVVNAHVIAHDKDHLLLGHDSAAGTPPGKAASADELADTLGKVAATGCRVVLLVDGVHATSPDGGKSKLDEWVRDLSRQNVVTFVASNRGPSELLAQNGAFFDAVKNSMAARAQARRWVDPKTRFTLDDLDRSVVAGVLDRTNRRQRAFCHVPETLSRHTPFLDGRPVEPPSEPAGR